MIGSLEKKSSSNVRWGDMQVRSLINMIAYLKLSLLCGTRFCKIREPSYLTEANNQLVSLTKEASYEEGRKGDPSFLRETKG